MMTMDLQRTTKVRRFICKEKDLMQNTGHVLDNTAVIQIVRPSFLLSSVLLDGFFVHRAFATKSLEKSRGFRYGLPFVTHIKDSVVYISTGLNESQDNR